MSDVAAWIAAGVTVVGVILAYLTYRSQRGRKRLEYAVVTNRKILPGRVARHLEVRHNGTELAEPSLLVVRLVNTGDKAITASDYETDLKVRFGGVEQIASAIWTGTRPQDLRPEIAVQGHEVLIKPTLINPEDILELQVIASGVADGATVTGRVSELELSERESLPYPPGSARGGFEMNGMDRFVWYVMTPALIVGIGIAIANDDRLSTTASVLTLVATGILAFVLYPLHVRYLVRRRRLWVP